MNCEFVIVLLIIVISTLFATKYTNNYNTQILFILGALGVVLVYKLLLYKNVNTILSNIRPESFTDFTDEINQFLSRVPDNVNNPLAAQEYKAQLSALQDKADIMNQYLADLKTQLNAKTTGNTLTDQYNIQASQQVQDYRIRKLMEDIQRANDLIKESNLRTDSVKYKKIPVMSSCVIQQADGSLNVDSNLATGSTGMGSGGSSSSTVSGAVIASSTPAQASVTGGGSVASGGAATGGQVTIQSLLEYIARNGINIKLTD